MSDALTPQAHAQRLVESLLVLLSIIGLWWLASHGQWVSKVFMPTPEAAWDSLVQGLTQGELLAFTQATVWRMVLGWGLACALGVALGALVGLSAWARAWIAPTLEFIRPLPASAVMPLAISASPSTNSTLVWPRV